jgi:hypothetical protein
VGDMGDVTIIMLGTCFRMRPLLPALGTGTDAVRQMCSLLSFRKPCWILAVLAGACMPGPLWESPCDARIVESRERPVRPVRPLAFLAKMISSKSWIAGEVPGAVSRS